MNDLFLLPLFDLGARLGITPPRNERQLVDGLVVLMTQPDRICLAVDELRELVETEPVPLGDGDLPVVGRLVLGAVRCGDGQLAPLLDRAALLTVRARQQLAMALDSLRSSNVGHA